MNIQEIVNQHSEEIVNIVNSLDLIKCSECFGNQKNRIGRSQLAKLLNAIQSANSIEEVKLFLYYQAAREKNSSGWNRQVDNKNVSQIICEKIDEVITLCTENLGIDITAQELVELKLKAGEKFLGYLYWKGTIYASRG